MMKRSILAALLLCSLLPLACQDQESPSASGQVVGSPQLDRGGADREIVDTRVPDARSAHPPPPPWPAPLVHGSPALDQALGLCLLPDHTLAIAGRSEGELVSSPESAQGDAFVARIDATGALSWVRQLGTPEVDQFLDVAYHPSGLILAGGFSTGRFAEAEDEEARLADGILVALDLEGNLRWKRMLSLGSVNRLAVTEDGVVAVGAYDLGGGEVAAFVTEYDLSGARQWVHTLNSPAYDAATSVTVREGALYVSGFTQGSIAEARGGEEMNIFVAALSAEGERRWVREYGSAGDDAAVRIAHSGEHLVVAGYTSGALGAQHYGDNDLALLKLDLDGELIWQQQFGTTGSEAAYGLSLNPRGEIFLSGRIDEASWAGGENLGGDAFLLTVSPEGEQVDLEQLSHPGRDELVDLVWEQETLTVAGYIDASTLGRDLELFVDRISVGDALRAPQ